MKRNNELQLDDLAKAVHVDEGSVACGKSAFTVRTRMVGQHGNFQVARDGEATYSHNFLPFSPYTFSLPKPEALL